MAILSFHYKRHNQYKAGSEQTETSKNLLVKVGFMSKDHFMLPWCLV